MIKILLPHPLGTTIELQKKNNISMMHECLIYFLLITYPIANPNTSRIADTTSVIVQSATVTTEVIVRVVGDGDVVMRVVVSGNVVVSLTVVIEVFSTVTVVDIAIVVVYTEVTVDRTVAVNVFV